MTREYQFVDGSRIMAVSADTVGRCFERMLRAGPLTAERVLSKARREDHPLHPAFEWDDSRAAEEYRLAQARHLTRSVQVVHEDGSTEPLVIHLVHEKCGGSAYVAMAVVAGDAELRAAALAEALGLLNGIARRYHYLDELSDVWSVLEMVADRDVVPV